MDEIISDNRQQSIVHAMGNMEFYPVLAEKEIGDCSYTKLPLGSLASLGTSFESLSHAVQGFFNASGNGSGIYKVSVPNGTHLAELKSGAGNIGTVLGENNQLAGQAVLNPLQFDPTMVLMAAALSEVNKKLDSIEETQKDMMEFLQQKEKSEMRGSLKFLADILNNYKYNWNNSLYKSGNHKKVLDIRETAERKIDFYRQQIISKINKKSLVHSAQNVNQQMQKIRDDFEDYQLALYINSFATFLEVMLLENFDKNYLKNITDKLEQYFMGYKMLYTRCYNMLEENAKTSVESLLLRGLGTASKATGKAVSKISIPVIEKANIDDTLLEAGEKLGKLEEKMTADTMKKLIEKQDVLSRPFTDSLKRISELYNQPVTMLMDKDNIYIGIGEQESSASISMKTDYY